MAAGVTVIKTTGRLIFELERGDEKTTRSLDVPYPKTDLESTELQEAVNNMNKQFTSAENSMNIFIQPANWRDANIAEEQWTTTRVSYEIVVTTTTPIEPDATE